MTVAQARALRELLERYRIALCTEPIDWAAHFGRTAPLVLEIGFGMGHALFETAQRHPEWNCLGVEVYRPGIGALLNAVEAARLTNVRVIEGDARAVLANMMTEGTLHRLIVFFPDPWPKSKHHKRRLINAEFATLAAQRLAAGGEMLVATDWEHYADAMQGRARRRTRPRECSWNRTVRGPKRGTPNHALRGARRTLGTSGVGSRLPKARSQMNSLTTLSR